MRLVIDASVALKWVMDEEGQQAAIALQDHTLLAPDFWLLEMANVLWRYEARGHLALAEAQRRYDQLVRAPVERIGTEADLSRALSLALQLRHPVYDCLYLALALREGVHVVTADRRFQRAADAGGHGAAVRLLGEA